MKRLALLSAAILSCAAPLAAQEAAPVRLSLEQRMLLRCSAAFALVAAGQDIANAEALQYPPLQDRGKEFFVRASARVMDEAGISFDQLEDQMAQEAQDIWDNGDLPRVMPACLQLLDQSGL